MTNYIVNNNNVRIFGDEEVNIQPNLPLGTYLVKENPMTGELYLEKTVNFTKPAKIYGDCEFQSERIITTFRDRPKNTGVLLNGAKGSGKTFLAKYISYKLLNENYSTIVINEIFNPTKLSLLLQTISEPCVIIFDEFEKIYQPSKNDNNNPQNGLLSLLDGLFQTKKLFIFTCNDDNNISDLMKNRPGRVYYKLEFKGINDKAIEEYCEEKLINKKYLSQIFSIKKMIKESYDIITDSPTKRIYEAVKQIPKGHVATYGQVAAMAGNPKMSRAVGNALHKNPDPENIPCFRVVNAKGELAGAFAFGGEGKQAKLLEEDGVVVVDGKVDLDVYGM